MKKLTAAGTSISVTTQLHDLFDTLLRGLLDPRLPAGHDGHLSHPAVIRYFLFLFFFFRSSNLKIKDMNRSF